MYTSAVWIALCLEANVHCKQPVQVKSVGVDIGKRNSTGDRVPRSKSRQWKMVYTGTVEQVENTPQQRMLFRVIEKNNKEARRKREEVLWS